ncbi:type IV secretory system conjugative DNA transfer family protein [Brevibacillus marinus]|uniref:type IV secretory system conjugative DNA transfer family protein n=1 Tax=Brevibacillus marinus TaxID=2496837 RepID=UPI001F49A302|nr:TraM recognition domain-containing protein [Brevibacillus marinus]
MVKEMADAMDMESTLLDPSDLPNSGRLNVMSGAIDDVVEATVAVLKGLFGKQEAFFATVQELSTRNVTRLLKELCGDRMDITDVLENLRSEESLRKNVELFESKFGETDLVRFFKSELLGDGDLAKKYKQLVIGLRAQLENVTSNRYLKSVITGKSTIHLDKHFEEGGILAANTALGLLGAAGDAFGQFLAMHLQLATFRRKGTEKTRVPHYLIIDEYSRYINPDVERFLSIAAEYRVAGIFALQSLGQIEMESGKLSAKAMKQAIMTSCRNKIAFGGIGGADAKEFAEEFGKEEVKERSKTYEGGLIPKIFPKTYRDVTKEKYRFHPTFLMDGLPRFHFVHKLIKNGHPQPPGIAKGVFVPRDWKERLVEETKPLFDLRSIMRPIPWLNKRLEQAKRRKVQALLQDDPFQPSTEAQKLEEENKRKFEQFLIEYQQSLSPQPVKGGDEREPTTETQRTNVSVPSGQTIVNKMVTQPENPFDMKAITIADGKTLSPKRPSMIGPKNQGENLEPVMPSGKEQRSKATKRTGDFWNQ